MRARMNRISKFAAAVVIVSTFGFTSPATADDTSADVNAQLAALNTDFRGWYADRRTQIMAGEPLILVVSNSGITAVRNTQQTPYPVDMTAYTQVKSMLHAVLGYQGLMRSTVAAGANPDWAKVGALVAQLDQAKALVPQTRIPSDLQPGVTAALSTLSASAQQAIDRHWVKDKQVQAALRTALEGLMPAVLWVGREHARDIKANLQTIKRTATKEEWNHVVAVATGPMTPRRDNLETAVTARVLGPELLGTRIFYAENLFSTSDALKYLGTVLGDSEFSVDMFDSATRMWRDLFAPVSEEYVANDFYTALSRG